MKTLDVRRKTLDVCVPLVCGQIPVDKSTRIAIELDWRISSFSQEEGQDGVRRRRKRLASGVYPLTPRRAL